MVHSSNVRSLALVLSLSGCVGSTGGESFSFEAFAKGPEGADGAAYSFEKRGYAITLTRAEVLVGAVYLNRAVPTSVSSDTSCTLAGSYVSELLPGFVVNALSREFQAFSQPGRATSGPASTGEVWLNAKNINDPSDSSVVLDVAGTAERDAVTYPFQGKLTIGTNRLAPTRPETPGAKPICKERVVSPIRVDIAPAPGGRLVLTVDPAGMFTNVDFSMLEPGTGTNDCPAGVYCFDDESGNKPSENLYNGLHASSGVYELAWLDD
jgi:hypothetical protein